MNLEELENQIHKTIKSVKEDGHDPSKLKVIIQIDDFFNGYLCTDNYELLYDNDLQVSDCVFHDTLENINLLEINNFQGVHLIFEERKRQIDLGWTKEHDVKEHPYALSGLVKMALQYINKSLHGACCYEEDKIKHLKKAGALIAAEIDRLIQK
ncbi:MAG: hypothetical protein GY714_03815 [Desulfobacterales bacterium]|nr:hypothetical protein [Desulfobacterales bacterium]